MQQKKINKNTPEYKMRRLSIPTFHHHRVRANGGTERGELAKAQHRGVGHTMAYWYF